MKIKLLKFSLAVALIFIAASAVISGINFILYPNGILFRLHPSMLENSPFPDFLLPGIISLIIVGGSSMLALLLMAEKSIYALAVALFAAILVITWFCFIALFAGYIVWINLVYWLVGFKIIVICLYLHRK